MKHSCYSNTVLRVKVEWCAVNKAIGPHTLNDECVYMSAHKASSILCPERGTGFMGKKNMQDYDNAYEQRGPA